MKPERLEELRQMAGAVDGPKSAWMDELIEEVDRLNLQNKELQKHIEKLCSRQLEDEFIGACKSHNRPFCVKCLEYERRKRAQDGCTCNYVPHVMDCAIRRQAEVVSENRSEGTQK